MARSYRCISSATLTFHARRRLAGYRLSATDAGWTAGDGPGITGTTVALLLLATGRVAAALPLLDGPGVPLLASTTPALTLVRAVSRRPRGSRCRAAVRPGLR